MSKRWLGVTVSGEKLTVVDAEVPDSGPIIINADLTIELPKGDRASAYNTIHRRLVDYATEKKIDKVFVKESALSLGGMKKGHLLSAELRGVALCAFASVCPTKTTAKASVSRNFGERKADEYIDDGDFWDGQISGSTLRIGSREAALYMLAARGK
jgi:hypothetical protein